MEITLNINGDCVFKHDVEYLHNIHINFKTYPDKSKLPIPANAVTKPKQITPYWLFVKDIQNQFKICEDNAKTVADLVWPAHENLKILYHRLAKQLKSEIRENGWILREPVRAISHDIFSKLQEVIDELGYPIREEHF